MDGMTCSVSTAWTRKAASSSRGRNGLEKDRFCRVELETSSSLPFLRRFKFSPEASLSKTSLLLLLLLVSIALGRGTQRASEILKSDNSAINVSQLYGF